MKQFFEQYGSVALGILALLVLIAMITPVGNIIKTSLQGTTETFSTRIESQTDTMTEQMNEAFEDANSLHGFVGDKFYCHGKIPVKLQYATIKDKTIILNGITYERVDVDVDVYVDGTRYPNGYPGVYFDIYKNGEKILENIGDNWLYLPLTKNDYYKIVVTDYPESLEIDTPEVSFSTYEIVGMGGHYYINPPIIAHNARVELHSK